MPSRPRKKAKVEHWPCAVCSENCGSGSVQCDCCSKWVHVQCEGLKTEYLEFLSGLSFMCRVCISKDDRDCYSYNNALFRLQEAAVASHEHLHVVTTREKTMMPCFRGFASYKRSELRVDFSSLLYLASCSGDIQDDHQPILTTGDGNCLFNALSIAICGTERLSEEIRVRTCVEMVMNRKHYVSQTYTKDFLFCSPEYDEACKQCATLGGYSSAWTIQAAADAIGRNIYAVYPKVNGKADHTAELLTRIHSTRDSKCDTVTVMWTKMGPHVGNIWIPNHFVPLISVCDQSATHLSSESNDCQSELKTEENQSESGGNQPKSYETTENQSETNGNQSKSSTSTETPHPLNSTVTPDYPLYESTKEISDISEIHESESDHSDHSENTEKNQSQPNQSVQPLPNGKSMSVEDLLNVINGDIPAAATVPAGVKDNVFVVLDGEENISRRGSGKQCTYYDDCGAWNGKQSRTCLTNFLFEKQQNGSTNVRLVHIKDGQICIEKTVKGKVDKTPIIPQPPMENVVILHRYYTVLKSNDKYKKRVSWFENLPEVMAQRKFTTIIEYQGINEGNTATHGNSKINEQVYKRAHPVTIKLVKEAVKHEKPVKVYGKLTKLDDSSLFPRDLRQIQNYKGSEKNNGKKSKNAADEIVNLISNLKDHKFVDEIIHNRDGGQPLVFCCSDEQLADITSFIKSNSGVIGIDRTFLLGKCYVTVLVYKSAKVVRKSNGEPPIMLGPLMLHWDGKTKTYYRFFSYLRGILDIDLKKVEMLIGTDDEKAMTNALDMTFPYAKRRLCTKHIKDNLLRNMTDKIPKSTVERNEIVNRIFGPNSVATANESAVFDERNQELKNSLRQDHPDFLQYYEKYVEKKISEHCVYESDELWTNNNTESINHRLKVEIDWKPQKTDELVEKLYDVVRVQHVDVRRSLYGTGNYQLNPRFNRFKVAEAVWRSKTDTQKHTHLLKFLNAVTREEPSETVTSSDGAYVMKKTQTVAKKPGQKTRAKATRTFTKRK